MMSGSTSSWSSIDRTPGYIWAGGVQPNEGPTAPLTKLGDTDYASSGHQVLRLHANKGITFNLDAIRRANPGWTLTRFISVAGNAENATTQSEAVSADIWVLVDGTKCLRLRDINGYNGAMPVRIPLAENSHYLTLVATDGGNDIQYDWTMFGDPCLELISHDSQEPSGSRSK